MNVDAAVVADLVRKVLEENNGIPARRRKLCRSAYPTAIST